MKKKLFALVLAGTMLIGGAVSVYADPISAPGEDGSYSQKVTVSSEITTPTISITVPTTATVTLNPYKIGEDAKQVSSDVYEISSASNVPIDVNATLKGVASDGSGVVLATAALTGKETTKSVFMYLEAYTDSMDEKVDGKQAGQLIVGKTAVTKKAIASLAEGDSEAQTVKYAFSGACSTTNTTAWAETDTVDIELTWSFTPVLVTD